MAQEGDAAGIEVSQEAGSDRLANLVDKDPLFNGAGRTRPIWPRSLTSLPAATSSCTRSTGALPTRATGCKHSAQTGMRLSKLVVPRF